MKNVLHALVATALWAVDACSFSQRRQRRRATGPWLQLCVGVLLAVTARAELTDEQRKLPLEVDAPDQKLTKIVLLAGTFSKGGGKHEYFAGSALLSDWLKQTPGVWPVLVGDGWPQNEAVLDGAKAIVIYMDAGPKLPLLEPERWAKLKGVVEKGAGLVVLHQSMDVAAPRATELMAWCGGAFVGDIGCRGHWDMDMAAAKGHAITRGVEPFALKGDGFLYNLHFAAGAVPLLAGGVPDNSRSSADAKEHVGRAETIAWAFERPGGGRGFGFTGGDLHANWGVEAQRKLVVNGVLWTAGVEVPESGAPCAMKEGALSLNLDRKKAEAK